MSTIHIIDHCGHEVRVSYAATSPELARIRRRHLRDCKPKPKPAPATLPDAQKIRRLYEYGECLLGHPATGQNTYTDETGVSWCRECSRLAQNGVIQ